MTELKDKVVLITGGSGGLGRALAGAFAGTGSKVVIAARGADKLTAAAKALSAPGRSVLAVPSDVADQKQVEALKQTTRAERGAVQILINNAGVARAASFLDMPDSLWQETLQTNLTGVYNCCKIFLPGMLESGWGRIINIASTTAKVGYSQVTAYSASKHGVLGLTRSLAAEFARRNITVNAICPGYLNNDLTRGNARRMAEKTGKSVDDVLALFAASAPQNRLIEPEEVAALALLLAGEKSAGITGQAINIDGGAVMV
jgi:NAD(P)-dependent dehydrogenase (short-subunit alcohol dehydrogenase family)